MVRDIPSNKLRSEFTASTYAQVPNRSNIKDKRLSNLALNNTCELLYLRRPYSLLTISDRVTLVSLPLISVNLVPLATNPLFDLQCPYLNGSDSLEHIYTLIS